MAELLVEKRTCPGCKTGQGIAVSHKDNLRQRERTGNLQTDLTPVSTTVTYRCQNSACSHEWTETTTLAK